MISGSQVESAQPRWPWFRGYLRFDCGYLMRHPFRILLSPICVLALLQTCAYAQDFASTANVYAQSANAARAPDPNQTSSGEKFREDQQPQGKKSKKNKIPDGIVIAPIPLSSPAIGTGAVLAGGYIFPIDRKDKVSPPSTVGGAYFGTDNGTRGFALYGELFMGENRYRTTTM
jgi:hypothetical protein